MNLAPPYPDEPISSALVRGCRHYGLTLGRLLKVAAPSASGQVSFIGAAALSPLADLFEVTPRRLLSEHTVVPYLTAYSPRPVWSKLISSVLSPCAAPISLGSVFKNSFDSTMQRRYCDQCVADDLRTLGESYWRLSHQLPGCFVCVRHDCILRLAPHRIVGRIGAYSLPQDVTGPPCLATMPPSIWHILALRSSETLRRGLHPPLLRSNLHYRNLAEARGWLKRGQHVDTLALRAAIENEFGQATLTAFGIEPSYTQNHWTALFLRKSQSNMTTTSRVLFIEELLATKPVDVGHRPSGPSPKPRLGRDAELAKAVSATRISGVGANERLTLRQLLERCDAFQAYRHSTATTMPMLHAAAAKFQQGAARCRPLAGELFSVPDSSGAWASRSDLVAAGHLIHGREAAARMGIHWYQMKPLRQSGGILSIPFQRRDWYPAFWFDGTDKHLLAQRLRAVRRRPLTQQWAELLKVRALAAGKSSSAPTDHP